MVRTELILKLASIFAKRRTGPREGGMNILKLATIYARIAEKIPGGLAAGKSDEDFDAGALAKGKKVEMEHTDDPEKAKEIARDHLTEDPKYYDKLAKMEGEE